MSRNCETPHEAQDDKTNNHNHNHNNHNTARPTQRAQSTHHTPRHKHLARRKRNTKMK
jgi:hypothetical protein